MTPSYEPASVGDDVSASRVREHAHADGWVHRPLTHVASLSLSENP